MASGQNWRFVDFGLSSGVFVGLSAAREAHCKILAVPTSGAQTSALTNARDMHNYIYRRAPNFWGTIFS